MQQNYPHIYYKILCLYVEYNKVLNGILESYHISLFILLSILLKSTNFFILVAIMLIINLLNYYFTLKKKYILTKSIFIKYPLLYNIIIMLFSTIHIMCLCICMDIIYESVFLPYIITVKNAILKWISSILKMAGLDKSKNSVGPSQIDKGSSSPNPSPDSSKILSETTDKKKKKKKNPQAAFRRKMEKEGKGEVLTLGLEFNRLTQACHDLVLLGSNDVILEKKNNFEERYYKFLPSTSKQKITELTNQYKTEGLVQHKGYDAAANVKNY